MKPRPPIRQLHMRRQRQPSARAEKSTHIEHFYGWWFASWDEEYQTLGCNTIRIELRKRPRGSKMCTGGSRRSGAAFNGSSGETPANGSHQRTAVSARVHLMQPRPSVVLGREANLRCAIVHRGTTRFRVRCGACHRAGQRPDPLASPRNDGVRRRSRPALLRCICMPNIAPCWLTWRQRAGKLRPCTRLPLPENQPHLPRTPVRRG